ncbi:MAG: LytTR family transcriptional regulator DNA-binding domain-containing protein [Candidatus Wallbacteria bacterium]|nr:LytTR family transcriptional regulator DNA-binding domain-containing protein [Candidatus Wallbacteria bacterium]
MSGQARGGFDGRCQSDTATELRKQAHAIERTLNQLGRLLPVSVFRVGGFCLVNLEQVREILGKEGDIRHHFKHSAIGVPVSRDFELGLRRALSVYTPEHLTPFNSFGMLIRQHELIDFGSREVGAVDRTSDRAPSPRLGAP